MSQPAQLPLSERQAAWQAARDAKVMEVRAQTTAAQLAEVRNVPAINNHSQALAADRAKVDVGTRLYMDAARIRAVKAELADAIAAVEYTGVPSITKTAAALQRDGNVGERLYAQAMDLDKRKKAIAEAEAIVAPTSTRSDVDRRRKPGDIQPPELVSQINLVSEEMQNGYAADTSRSKAPSEASFQHNNSDLLQHVSPSVTSRKSNPAAANLLYTRAEIYRQRQEDRIAQAEREARERANPDLNKKSLEMAAALSPDRIDRFYKRSLSSGKSQMKLVEAAEQQSPPDPEATHHPKILPQSAALAARRNPTGVPATTRLFAEATVFRARREELSRRKEVEELRQCTFHPNQRSASVDPERRARGQAAGSSQNRSASVGRMPQKGQAPPAAKPNTTIAAAPPPPPKMSPRASADLYRKQVAWAEERRKRLEEERLKREREEIANCTFQPLHGVDAVLSVKLDALKARRSSVHKPAAQTPEEAQDSFFKSSAYLSRSGVTIPLPPPPVPSVEVYKGVDDFVNRCSKGRQLAYEKANPKFADGSKWTGRTTRAKTFQFVKRGGQQVKALQPPVPHAAGRLGVQGYMSHASADSGAAHYANAPPRFSPTFGDSSLVSPAASSVPFELATADDIMARVKQLETLSTVSGFNSGKTASSASVLSTSQAAPKHDIHRFFGPPGLAVPAGVQRDPTSSAAVTDAYFFGSGPLSPKGRPETAADPLLQRIERMASAAAHLR